MMGKKGKEGMVILFMPDCGEDGVIQLWSQGAHSWVEARGRPYSQWDENEDTPFSRLHDALLGAHTSNLHEGRTLIVRPVHPDYEAVMAFMEQENVGPEG